MVDVASDVLIAHSIPILVYIAWFAAETSCFSSQKYIKKFHIFLEFAVMALEHTSAGWAVDNNQELNGFLIDFNQ